MSVLKVPKNTTSSTYHILVWCALVMNELYGHEANILNKPLRKAEQGGSANLCLGGN
jgi:hypothetical protein